VCRGFAAFGRGAYAAAVDELFAVRTVAHTFGGSVAQRDVLELTLLEAALRGKQFALARGLARARQARKPNSPAPARVLSSLYTARSGAA
jgi:hypothetical protein